ncbi:MAG TPA: nitrilase-related carbon-nitrogen hydrolase, partial [Acidocella sp.]|nr:nitrilase-related carbon-nitrogen hydrolase [Acidocella sp.]
MRVSVIQMSPRADKAQNIAQARRLIEAAVAADAPGLVALPEVWTCLGGDRAAKFAQAEALPAPGETGGPAYEFLREM